MELQFQPEPSSLVPRNLESASATKIDGEEASLHSGRGAGGKLRSSRRASKRSTPYDRPTELTRRADVADSSASPGIEESSSSLASRLVGSASRLISSSVSYLFPALFGRRTFSLPQSVSGRDKDALALERDKEEKTGPLTENDTPLAKTSNSAQEPEQVLGTIGFERTGRREVDLASVEDILRRKSWSRDQVSRLTEILSTRLTEDHLPISWAAEADRQPNVADASAGKLTTHRGEENTATPISEAQRWREDLKRARTECMPVEVAKAYMGERTLLQSSITHSFQANARPLDRVAELQPPPGLGLTEDRYRYFPVLRSRTRLGALHVAKNSPPLDEEWMSIGPVRRTRHKLFHINSSPYSRPLPVIEHAASRTCASPPERSSQTAQKILDTLEVLSPFPKAKHKGKESDKVGLSGNVSHQGSQSILHIESKNVFSSRNLGLQNGGPELGSPIKLPMSAKGNNEDSLNKDVDLVNSAFPSRDAKFFPTSSLLGSSAAVTSLPHSYLTFLSSTPGPFTATLSESVSSFAFTFPSFMSASSHTKMGAAHAPMNLPFSVTSTSGIGNAEALFSSPTPVRKEHSGADSLFAGRERASAKAESDPSKFQFSSPSMSFPLTFNTGAADPPPLTEKGLPSALGQDSSSGAQRQSLQSVNTTFTDTLDPAESLFVTPPSTSPLFKLSGHPFGPSTITKAAPITSVNLEASSAPFSFSTPQPLPAVVSCPIPTFSFGSSAGSVSVSFDVSSSRPEAVNTSPVFTFTSPSEGSELPVTATDDTCLPSPSFSFGAGLMMSSGPFSTFCFNTGTSFSSSHTALASTMSQTGDGLCSMPQSSSFGFTGQAPSGQLFEAVQSSSVSFVETSRVSTGLEASASLSTGASMAEKAGRKFVKLKRRK